MTTITTNIYVPPHRRQDDVDALWEQLKVPQNVTLKQGDILRIINPKWLRADGPRWIQLSHTPGRGAWDVRELWTDELPYPVTTEGLKEFMENPSVYYGPTDFGLDMAEESFYTENDIMENFQLIPSAIPASAFAE